MSMKNFSVVIVYLLCLLSCKENTLKHEIVYYENGNKNFEHVIDENKKTQSKVKIYYPNGKLKMLIYFKNGISCGQCYKFHENGKIKYVTKVYNEKFKDTLWRFDEKGKILNKYVFGKGLAQDTVKEVEYYPNGSVKSETATIQGQKLTPLVSYTLQYSPTGKINFDNSNFVYIQYLNKSGTKIKFTIKRGSDLNILDFQNRVGITMNLKNNFNDKFSLEKNNVRTIELPNSNSFVVTFSKSDFINNKLNINLIERFKPYVNEKSMFLYLYNIQLIKGDKSRWHNVHGIVKEGNGSLMH